MNTRRDDPWAVLRVASRYVARFRGALFVLKLSGVLTEHPARLAALASEIRLLHDLGIHLLVVHGAGSGIDRVCARRGIPVRKIGGRRLTTPEVLEVVVDCYRAINQRVTEALEAAGMNPSGVFGQEEAVLQSRRRPPAPLVAGGESITWGEVGDLTGIDTVRFRAWIQEGILPVVAPLTQGPRGEILNTNADTVAAALASALRASKLIFLLSVPGLLREREDRTTVIPYADLDDLARLEAEGGIQEGMVVKLRAIESALHAGVESIHLVSGTDPDALIQEVFTHEGSGTMIVSQKREAGP